ncbi:hypothetical protein [Mycolicibacterium sp. XJ1819]
MNTRKTLVSMISGAAALGGIFGAMATAAPAVAAPGQTGANLHVIQDPANQGNYLLAIIGRFPMPQADAVGFLNNINNGDCQGGMNYYIYADDDEIYAQAHFKDSDCKIRVQTSQVITRLF